MNCEKVIVYSILFITGSLFILTSIMYASLNNPRCIIECIICLMVCFYLKVYYDKLQGKENE